MQCPNSTSELFLNLQLIYCPSPFKNITFSTQEALSGLQPNFISVLSGTPSPQLYIHTKLIQEAVLSRTGTSFTQNDSTIPINIFYKPYVQYLSADSCQDEL